MPAVIKSSVSAWWPGCFATDHENILYFLNGVNRGQIWDGVSGGTLDLGIDAPSVAPTVVASPGGGATAGTYICYYRYKDALGRYSNLSPPVSVAANDNDKFSWTNIPSSTNSRVTHKELLRSVSNDFGDGLVLYLIATISNLDTQYLNDTASDSALEATTPYPVQNADGFTLLNRFTPPPASKSVVVCFYDRAWYLVDVPYFCGHCSVVNGSASVTGVGTAWTSEMVGRKMYFPGNAAEYTISAVSSGTSLTLSQAFSGATNLFQPYCIRVDRHERRRVYYSRAVEFESVPANNNIYIQEMGDEITGAMPLRNYLYVLSENHLHQISMANQGGSGGATTSCICAVAKYVSSRGCINHRCWVAVDGIGYLLDSRGIHRFSEFEGSQHLSSPIQDLWNPCYRGRGAFKLNFASSRWWFASLDPARELIRWHVSLGNWYLPQHAICLAYRTGKLWIEDFPWGFGGFAMVSMNGVMRPVFGGEYGGFRVQEGTKDGPVVRSVRGKATAATLYTVSDTSSAAEIPSSGVTNAPLHIVGGDKGKAGVRQSRRIVSSSSGTMVLKDKFLVLPSTDSRYQVGGVGYRVKLPVVEWLEDSSNNERQISVMFQPTEYEATMNVRRYVDQSEFPDEYRASGGIGDGVEVNGAEFIGGGDPDAVLDMKRARSWGVGSGYRAVRVDGRLSGRANEKRYCQVELSGVQGDDSVVVHEIRITGTNRGESNV